LAHDGAGRVNAAPLPDAPSATADAGAETSETLPGPALAGPDRRLIAAVGGAGGALILVVGTLLLTVLPLGPPDPTFAEKVALPVALIALGVAFLAISVGGLLYARDLTDLVVDRSRVELRFSRGARSEFRWDDPQLELSLSHVVSSPPKPNATTGWVLAQRGSGRPSRASVTLEAGTALVRWGRRAGLEMTTLQRDFPTRRGRAVFEITILAPVGGAHPPAGDWRTVTTAPELPATPGTPPGEAAHPSTDPSDDPHLVWTDPSRAFGPVSTDPPVLQTPPNPPRLPHC
jgi:hypothetical protein